MKILIINTPRYNGSSVTREGRCELIMHYRVDNPATLLIIASLLRDGNHQINFIDANGLDLSYKSISLLMKDKKYDVIIFFY
jgi:FMN-dependent NADH-azoreductase